MPANPRAWLVSAGRFKAIDAMRRRARFDAALSVLGEQLDGGMSDPEALEDEGLEDDQLRLKYHDAIADAVADLGQPEEIGRMFAGFQKYLYPPQVAV